MCVPETSCKRSGAWCSYTGSYVHVVCGISSSTCSEDNVILVYHAFNLFPHRSMRHGSESRRGVYACTTNPIWPYPTCFFCGGPHLPAASPALLSSLPSPPTRHGTAASPHPPVNMARSDLKHERVSVPAAHKLHVSSSVCCSYVCCLLRARPCLQLISTYFLSWQDIVLPFHALNTSVRITLPNIQRGQEQSSCRAGIVGQCGCRRQTAAY